MFYYVDGGVYGNCGEECLDIIRCHDLSRLQLDLLVMLYEVLGIFEVMWTLANQGTDDVGQFLGHSMMDLILQTIGLRGASFVYFVLTIEIGGNCTGGIHNLNW